MSFSPIFILEQYFLFHTTKYWFIVIPAYIFLALSPVVYRLTKSINLYGKYLIFFGFANMLVMIGLGGGNLAPGVFWLTAFPMVFGLFYGTQGVKVGSLVMSSAFVSYILMNEYNSLPNLISNPDDYQNTKFVNLICFGIYNIFISFYSIKIETTAKKDLFAQRQETENLLRILVHDIATPVSAVQLMTHAMKKDGHNAENMLNLLENALDDMSGIVQQVSKLRALKDGKLALDLSKVNVIDAIQDCLTLTTPIAAQKSITLTFQAPTPALYARADASLLKSVIFCNVISNAIKFSHPGQAIEIDLKADESTITIQLTDHGLGMPPELLAQVFDPTTPTTRRGTQGEKGTGFGLPLVKMLLNKLDGDIAITSDQSPEQHGTCVTLTLPRIRETS